MTEDKQIPVTPEALTQSVINMAVESWRFGRVFDRVLAKLDAGQQSRYKGQFRWFIKKIEESLAEAGLRLVLMSKDSLSILEWQQRLLI